MAKLQDVPCEVFNLIIYFVCIGIINEYRIGIDPSTYSDVKFLVESFHPKTPRPAPLHDFASVLQVCRFFHEAIIGAVKIEGFTAVQTLQTLQYQGGPSYSRFGWAHDE